MRFLSHPIVRTIHRSSRVFVPCVAWAALALLGLCSAGCTPTPNPFEGVWYIQTSPDGHAFHREAGQVYAWDYTPEGEARTVGAEPAYFHHYTVDPKAGTVTRALSGDPSQSWQSGYDIDADGVLHIWHLSQPGTRPFEYELTRNPEGLPRHEALRQADQETYSAYHQQDSEQRLFMLVKVANTFTDYYRTLPPDLGTLVTAERGNTWGFMAPQDALAPWSEAEVPDDFERWGDREMQAWVNRHSAYVYLGAGRTVEAVGRGNIVAFEVAPRGQLDRVAVMTLRPMHVERLPYDEADARVYDLTGHSLEQWLEAELPGAGLMTSP